MIQKIFIGILVFILVGTFIFIILGLVHKPGSVYILFDPGEKTLKKCDIEKVPCAIDSDCSNSCMDVSGTEFVCKTFGRKNEKDVKKFGPPERICVPKETGSKCNEKTGGILSWTYQAEPDRMEWGCMCSYPDWAAAPGPDGMCSLNPDVCKGGTFTWDATTGDDPSPNHCICPKGTTRMVHIGSQIPICVPDEAPNPILYSGTYKRMCSDEDVSCVVDSECATYCFGGDYKCVGGKCVA